MGPTRAKPVHEIHKQWVKCIDDGEGTNSAFHLFVKLGVTEI
jgi:hypothetical protein